MERKAYPRPELVRKNWTNLNGKWDFEFDFGVTGRERKETETGTEGVPREARTPLVLEERNKT